MSQRKKNNIIIGSLCAVVLLMVVGYAAFSSILNINGTSSISSNWDIEITAIDEKNIVGGATTATKENGDKKIEGIGTLTASFETNLVSPGDSIEYDITITNKGSLNAKLDNITLSEPNNEAIIFTTSGLTEGTTLPANNGTAVLTVKVEYSNAVTSQPDKTIGNLTVTLDYSQDSGSEVTPGGETAADMLIAGVTDSGDGLYEDEYESGRYIYKGANPNNYITFNNEPWRILSVEANGTIKLFRNISIGNQPWDSTNVNDWTRPATLNTYLNDTFYNSLDSNDRTKIADSTFSVGAVRTENTDVFPTTYRTMPQIIEDEKQTLWKGKIALLTISDRIRTYTNTESCGSYSDIIANEDLCADYSWVFNNTNSTKNYFWLLSPYIGYDWAENSIYISNLKAIGQDSANFSNFGVVPVLYLKSDINLSGEGTQSNPYIIN